MSLAADYIKRLLKRGLEVDSFARRMAFFSAAHLDLFEEVAKLRAMRRIWSRMLKEKFGAKNEKSMWFRTAIQTAALAEHRPNSYRVIFAVNLNLSLAARGGKVSLYITALINNRILDKATRSDRNIVTDDGASYHGEWRNNHVVADTGCREDTYTGADITIAPDNHRADDIRARPYHGIIPH